VSHLAEQASDLAFAAGWRVVRTLPEPVAQATFRAFADQAWRRNGSGVRQLERNLRRVVPEASDAELRALTRAGMRSYLRYWCEVFRLPDVPVAKVVDDFHVRDGDRITDGLATGRGVILALPHTGNWDHAGTWASAVHQPLTTVAERLRPESLYDRFVAYREGLGMEILPLTGGESPFRVLLERARAGRLICLLADRDLTANGLEVPFFGETAKLPAGPAALAVASGAILLPVTLWFEPDGVTGAQIHPEIEVPAAPTRGEKVALMTRQLATAFEEGIRAHPEDWHMLQRLWLADLDPRPQAQAARETS
jgi:KDO2-lipid IV(A) lauroyltransferase